MDKLIIDASAWVEYLTGSQKGEKVRKYFEEYELYTSTVSVSEVIAKMLREGFSEEIAILAIPARSQIVPIDFGIASDAGKAYYILRKKKDKISLSDTICLSTARKISGKVLTFDNDFRGIAEAIVL